MKLSNSPDTPKTSPTRSTWGRLAIVAALAATPSCNPKKTSTFSSEPRQAKEWSTLNLTPPENRHPESSEASRRALALKGYMDPKEVATMQSVHEKMYVEYMNPALMQYLKQAGLTDKVYPSLDLIMKHPHAFEYIQKDSGMVEVVKQRPYTDELKHIPNDFKVVMDSRAGNIVEVGGKDLRTPKGTIPWISNAKYNGRMADYREQWKNELGRIKYANWNQKLANLPTTEPERTKAWKKLNLEPLMKVSEDMRDMFELDNVRFPERFVALVAARGAGFEFEEKDPRFQNVKKHQALQGTSYRELTQDSQNKFHIVVTADPDAKGAYRIQTVTAEEPLRVTAEGYMMIRKPDGSWVADPRYDKALSKQYYKTHPNAPKKAK